MQRDVSDLDGIYPSYITGVISTGPLIEYDCKMHGHAEISQYEILTLFVVTKYALGSRNIILNYAGMTLAMSCVQYRYKGKKVIVHMTSGHGKVKSNHKDFYVCLGNYDVLLDTTRSL